MTHLLIQEIEKKQENKKVPVITAGCTVKIHQKIKEGTKERVQVFEGLVIAVNAGRGAGKTIMVRKIVQGIGVEKIFPLSNPSIQKIEIIRVGKVRRAKLYYMRDISGKAARLKEKMGEKKRLMEAMGVEVAAAEQAVKDLQEAEAQALAAETEQAEQATQAEVIAETPSEEQVTSENQVESAEQKSDNSEEKKAE